MRREKTITLDHLEPRRLLAAVTVSGSNSADEIRVYVQSNTIIVDVSGAASSYPDFLYDGIVVNALGGADSIVVDSNTDNAVTINGGSGVDTIEIGKTDQTLAGIESAVSISNSNGADKLYVHSEADSSVATYTITSSNVTRTGYPVISTGDSGLVAVAGGAGTDTFVMTSTGASNRYELRGGAGADTFDIRNTNGATVVVDGEADLDLIQLNSDVGTPATIQFEATQDLSRIDASAGGVIKATGATGIYLGTNLSDFEGDLLLETGFLIEHNSQSAGGLGYWKQRLLDAQTGTTPQVRSTFADSSAANDAIGYGYSQNTVVTDLGGFSLVSGDLILRYTLRGDANLDARVNFDDLLILAQNYSPSTTGRLWTQGDFDLNGLTNFDDLLTLAQTYGQTALVSRGKLGGRATARDMIA